jgi:drug/metabolite transporter (DMT)-like permease
MSRRGVLLCFVAAALFGISAPVASRLADDMSPFVLAGLLYLGAGLAVLPVAGRSLPTRRAFQRGAPRLAMAVGFGGGVGPVLLAAGLSRVPAATASLLLNLELVFTVLLAASLFREHLGRRVLAGTGFVMAAGLTLAWSGSAELRWGAALIAAACGAWAIDNCVTAALDELTPGQITFVKGVVAGGANLVIGLALGGATGGGWPVIWALVIGAIGYGLSITFWVAGARELGAARGQLVFATAPFIGAILAWTVLDENATSRQLVSLTLAAIGVSFVLRSAHWHEHAHPTVEHDHAHSHDDGHHDDHGGDRALRDQHVHRHASRVHAHPHVPDIHHRHEHPG